MNILILSCGTRNKIIQYFRKILNGNGNVIATDCNVLAPAVYDADKFYTVPKMSDNGYLKIILDICHKENINGILTLIDPELSLLAKNKDLFKSAGVQIIGSSYDLCEMALDKWQMYNWLRDNGYKCARSFINKEDFYEAKERGEINYPVFVKPARGSASISISKVYDKNMLELLFKYSDGLMIQETLNGQEIGADCYIDLISGELISVFTKKKLLMRAGETDKSVSFKEERLFGLIEKFVNQSGFSGVIDIDLFEINGEYYISEVNPRFGGGYPHAHECGVDFITLIINNLNGGINIKNVGAYNNNVHMMK